MRPTGTFDIHYSQDMAIVRTNLQWILLVIFFLGLMIIPHFVGRYLLSVLSLTGISLIAVLGLHIITGLCGQLNLGQSAFMGVGAYTSAVLVVKLGWPFLVALPCAGIMAGLSGLVFGAPSLRLKELYLAMATLASQFIIVYVLNRMEFITNGALGMTVPPASIFGFVFDTPISQYYLIIVIAIIAGLAARNITRSRAGRAFIAIRDNDLAAEVMGVDLFFYKLTAFFTGCFFAGIAGALWAHYMSNINPEQFTLKDSVWMLGMLVVGGLGSTLGAIMGTIFIRFIDIITYYASPLIGNAFPFLPPNISFAVSVILFALVIILFLVFEPRGLSHRWGIFKASYRLWPYAY